MRPNPTPTPPTKWARISLLSLAALTAPAMVAGQAVHGGVTASLPNLRVVDARLDVAMQRLVGASPRAADVIDALSRSGLEVAVGTPAELAALPDSEGGPAPEERSALLSDPGMSNPDAEPPIAWVVFRVAAPAADAPEGTPGMVERAWVAVEADSVEDWIRDAHGEDAQWRVDEDFLAILAHEFVAHVGSIAGSRRLDDFCDDPPTGQDAIGAQALACSIQVENTVRRELNGALGLRGDRKLPQRANYTLETMQFAQAHVARH